jgi:hypothetical protein
VSDITAPRTSARFPGVNVQIGRADVRPLAAAARHGIEGAKRRARVDPVGHQVDLARRQPRIVGKIAEAVHGVPARHPAREDRLLDLLRRGARGLVLIELR